MLQVVSGMRLSPQPFDVDMLNDKLYFTDWARMGIVSVAKFGGVDVNTTTDVWTNRATDEFPMALRVYDASKQLTINNSTVSRKGGVSAESWFSVSARP